MALSFIGKPISLISHSDVRYRGILAGIDPAASTIQLSNVFSMGTESRRPPAEFIPPVQEPYEYIIFRASEVKDLAVDEPAPRRSVHDDPAVLGASAPVPAANTYPQFGNAPPYSPGPATQSRSGPATQSQPQASPHPPTATASTNGNGPSPAPHPERPANATRRSNPVHTASASLETVERALGDLRVSHHPNATRGGRRGHKTTDVIKVPATDFDFQGSNAKFDKAALAPKLPKGRRVEDEKDDDEVTNPSDAEGEEKAQREKENDTTAYNPQKSFFDSLSSSNHGPPTARRDGPGPQEFGGRGGGFGRRGGAGGRNRREEERERNVATFGEPGGVGLMGPGAYVGGWGGYGRRGGRPRRGVGIAGGR